MGEGILGCEPEIAHATALGEQHDVLIAEGREGDVRNRMAASGADDGLGLAKEVGQEEFTARGPNVDGDSSARCPGRLARGVHRDCSWRDTHLLEQCSQPRGESGQTVDSKRLPT